MNYEDLRGIQDIPENILKIFIPFAKEEHYRAGERVFEEDSSADRFFIIKEGSVEIRKVIEKDKRYKQIAVLLKGEFFGEIAVFLEQSRSAEARARTDVTLLAVTKDNLSALLKQSPDTALKVMGFFASVLMERLQTTTSELTAMYEVGRLITSSRSILELSNNVMAGILKTIKSAEAGFFALWNDFNSEFEVPCMSGFKTTPSIRDDDPLVEWFLAEREAFLSFDLQNDPTIGKESIYQGHSMVATPFFLHDRLLGFMCILNRTRQNAFSYDHMILLSAIAGYVSVTIDNLKYMQDEIDRLRLKQTKSTIPL